MKEPEQRAAGPEAGVRSERRYRGGSIGARAATAIIMALVIAVMVNYLAGRHYRRFDWTAEGYYTLSSKTINILHGLKKPVDVTVFMSTASGLFADVRELLARYESYTKKLDVEYVDPDIDKARFELLQKKYNIRSGTLPDGRQIAEQVIVVAGGEQAKFVTPEEMTDFEFEEDPYATAPTMKGFKAEEELTSAILGVTESKSAEICFVMGHGEWSVDRYDERGIGHLDELLKRDNYKLRSFSVSEKKKIPDDCLLVVVPGPERPFTPSDEAKLARYLEGGGNLLLLLDPIIDGTRFVPTGLEGLLRKAGVEARRAVVVESDEARLLPVSGVGMETFITKDYGEHQIVAPLEGIETLFRIAMPLSPAGGTGMKPEALVTTSGSSWGETDLEDIATGEEPEKEDADVEGPLTLGFACTLPGFAQSKPEGGGEEKETQKRARGRIVVFGDSDMLHSDLFGQLTLVNQELVMGSIAWLAERPALISIAPKNPENVRLNLTDAQMKTILFWILINIPLLAVIAGFVVWWRRRK